MFVKAPISAAMKDQLRHEASKPEPRGDTTTPVVKATKEKVWENPEDEFRVDL